MTTKFLTVSIHSNWPPCHSFLQNIMLSNFELLLTRMHDLLEKRTACDALPNAAAVAASACAIGSSRGYDELIPRNLSVVTERRAYYDYSPQSASDKTASETAGGVTLRTTEGLDFTTVHVVGSWDGWTQRHMLTRDQGAWAIALTKVFASLDGQPGNSDEYQVCSCIFDKVYGVPQFATSAYVLLINTVQVCW